MPLDDLLALVGTLRRVVDIHGSALRESQPLTRYALVDPLLRRLGWDTEDPALVVPEYRSGSGAHDYGLLDDGRLVALVEAHALDDPFRENADALRVEARDAGAPFAAVTDGWRWRLYAAARETDALIAVIDLAGDAEAVCVDALALWRPLLLSRIAGERQTLNAHRYADNGEPGIRMSDKSRCRNTVPNVRSFPIQTQIPNHARSAVTDTMPPLCSTGSQSSNMPCVHTAEIFLPQKFFPSDSNKIHKQIYVVADKTVVLSG